MDNPIEAIAALLSEANIKGVEFTFIVSQKELDQIELSISEITSHFEVEDCGDGEYEVIVKVS